jgi:N-formylglutamate amidohydrolase
MKLSETLTYPKNAQGASAHVQYLKGDSQLFLEMPHIGVLIPEEFPHKALLARPEVWNTVIAGVDFCIPFATGALEYDSATKIWSTLPRALVDLNRLPTDVDPRSVENAKEEAKAHGLYWHATLERRPEDIADMLRQPYTEEEHEELLSLVYKPYIKTTQRLVREIATKHGRAVYWALHSMMPDTFEHVQEGKYAGAYIFPQQAEREALGPTSLPDIIITDHGEGMCDDKITDIVESTFTRHGFLVGKKRVAPSTMGLPRHKVAKQGNNVHVIATEIVGYDLEQERVDGVIYDDIKQRFPEKLERMQAAFHDAFHRLEAWK